MSADLAANLDSAGYDGLFLAGDHSAAATVYAGNHDALDAIVNGAGEDRARILAAEVLYDQADGPRAPAEVLAQLYAHALQLTGNYVFPGNLWGMLWASAGYDGPLGEHLLAQGQAAIGPLIALLDNDSPLFYEGSKEAIAGNRHSYRVKDAAAYFLGRLTGRDVPFHEAHEDRDAEIERLKADAADPDELERQLERGAVFTHSVLTDHAERTNENEALLNGLIDVLIKRGLVNADELTRAIAAVRRETDETGGRATVGVALRVDGPLDPPTAVDCERRLPICKAACCRMRFALSTEDIEAGALKWDLARPYYNRRGPDGYCHRCDADTHACGVYEQRPTVCRGYSCAGDPRIWTDFDAMELNHDWIEANLGGDELGPVEIFMDAHARP